MFHISLRSSFFSRVRRFLRWQFGFYSQDAAQKVLLKYPTQTWPNTTLAALRHVKSAASAAREPGVCLFHQTSVILFYRSNAMLPSSSHSHFHCNRYCILHLLPTPSIFTSNSNSISLRFWYFFNNLTTSMLLFSTMTFCSWQKVIDQLRASYELQRGLRMAYRFFEIYSFPQKFND